MTHHLSIDELRALDAAGLLLFDNPRGSQFTMRPKFKIGQTVYKHTGNYGGTGIVRGIANDTDQPLRYLVGHKIEGGFGEFYHVYAEGNLREVDDAGSTD